MCSFDSCERPQYCGSLCRGHYAQRRRGRDLTPIATRGGYGPVCSFAECELPSQAKGLCRRHYQQHLRGGSLAPIRTIGALVECRQCSRPFARTNGRSELCSTACRLAVISKRQCDLYRLSVTLHRRGQFGKHWRRVLLTYLRERDGDKCQLCRRPIRFDLPSGIKGDERGPSVDHIVPRSKGGDDDLANLRLTHWGCNRSRGNRGGAEQLALIG